MISKKRGAMEMSVGTIVTIVLLMTVLILGLILVRTIFKGAVESIEVIDQAVKNEIDKLFSEDESIKVVVYPPTRRIIIKKGEDSRGFGFSIRNVGNEEAKFSYNIKAEEVDQTCPLRLPEADDLIALGRQGSVSIAPATFMDNPIFVRFSIPDDSPACQVRYSITIEKGTRLYGSSVEVDLVIKP